MRFAVFFLFVFFLGMMWDSHGATKENFVPRKFKATFTQEYKSQITGKIRSGNGTLDYEFPSKLRFEMIKPDPIIFITNMAQNWYYRPPYIQGEKGELKKNVKGGNVFADFFDSLSEGLKTNTYYRVSISKSRADITFSQDHGPELGLKGAKLLFKPTGNFEFLNLKEINLIYLDGRETKILFNSLSSISSFPKSHFYFQR